MIFYLINFILIQIVNSSKVTDSIQFQKIYGSKFHVDVDYPREINYTEYCTIEKNVEVDNTTCEIEYPKNLLLTLIHTVPSKISHIIHTRETWCQEQLQDRFGFKCIFILVESTVDKSDKRSELLQMNETFHDIYFIDLPDLTEQWFTLQQKNINAYIMAMDLFPDYNFYSRVDDEIVVTVDVLSSLLSRYLNQSVVIGDIVTHRPNRNPHNKYYDPLAKDFSFYFPFPAGYLSLFSRDIIQYIAKWEHYYTFAPSSLEDPGFGQWIYKYAKLSEKNIKFVTPISWGGNVRRFSDDYIVYHSQRGKLNQTKVFQQQCDRGYMSYPS